MEVCQNIRPRDNMSKQFILNKNKSIGKVIYIVEGERKEITLLSHIFTKILNYTVIQARRQEGIYEKYVSAENPDSQVYLINSETSNIGSLRSASGREYLDSVFKTLYEKYQLDTTNTATYYVFDRDCGSNLATDCQDLVGILKNSRDNGYESNGLLLLSYPSIESYIFSCVEDSTEEYIDTASALKQITGAGKYQYNKLKDKEMLQACTNMLATQLRMSGVDIEPSDLDDFSKINGQILEIEDEKVFKDSLYRILSFLSISFIDLGIITEIE